MEVWKPIPSEPGYEVSDLGRVRSVDRTVHTVRGLWRLKGKIRAQYDKDGYRRVTLSGSPRGVHVLVLEAFVGPCPESYHGLHGDGKRHNNRLSNLRWGSPSENERDKTRQGTRLLTFETACAIRQRYVARCKVNGARAIAKELGLENHTVEAVLFKKDHYREY